MLGRSPPKDAAVPSRRAPSRLSKASNWCRSRSASALAARRHVRGPRPTEQLARGRDSRDLPHRPSTVRPQGSRVGPDPRLRRTVQDDTRRTLPGRGTRRRERRRRRGGLRCWIGRLGPRPGVARATAIAVAAAVLAIAVPRRAVIHQRYTGAPEQFPRGFAALAASRDN